MEKLTGFLKDRFGENSTWLGLALMAYLSAKFTPEGAQAIMNAVAVLLSAYATVHPDKQPDKPQ